jgi:hypothetical protein
MTALRNRAEQLKTKLEAMYKELTTALDTPAGKAVELTAGEVLIKPIDDLLKVIQYVSETLSEIIGTGYYKDVFIEFVEVNESVKLN